MSGGGCVSGLAIDIFSVLSDIFFAVLFNNLSRDSICKKIIFFSSDFLVLLI